MAREERVETVRGYRYIRLKTGRLLTFWDLISLTERAHTDLGRGLSRLIKLATEDYEQERDDYQLERVEWVLDHLEEHVGALRAYIARVRGIQSKRERIERLRDVSGRTPEEAKVYLRKADELERALGAGS